MGINLSRTGHSNIAGTDFYLTKLRSTVQVGIATFAVFVAATTVGIAGQAGLLPHLLYVPAARKSEFQLF